MNSLPFVHFFCLLLYVYLAGFVLVRNPKAPVNRVCAAVFICFALWSLDGIFSHSHETSKAAISFIENITAPGWISFPGFFFWGTLLLTKTEKILKSRLFYPALFLPPLLFVYQQWTKPIVVAAVKCHFGWGIVWSSSIWTYLYYAYVTSLLAASLFLVLRYWLKADSPVIKKGAKIFFLTTLTSFSIGFLTDIVLPRLQLYVFPDIADIAAIITASGLTYIVVKYKFLTITPATAAENIIATMSDSLILLDAAGNIVKVNRATVDLLGYRETELKGNPLGILIKEPQEHPANTLFEKIQNENEIINYELTFKTKQDTKIPVIFSSSTLKDEEGKLIGLVCISRDITRRKQSEEELQAYKEHLEELVGERTDRLKEINRQLQNEKEKYRTLTENINVGIYRHMAEEDGTFIEVNPAIIKMFGYDHKDEFLATGLSRHYHNPEDIKWFNQKMAKYGFVKNEELQLKRKDGTPFIGSVSMVAVKDSRGNVICCDGIIEDVTRRKRLEEHLIESQKVEAVDRLTGGIAHEFNNILTTIIGYTELTQMDLESGGPVEEYLDGILKTSEHAQELISQLMTFSRKAITEPKIINLNRILTGFQTLIQKLIGVDVILDFIPGEDLGNVKADPRQIEQVIINLVTNSRDAMSSGGKLTISTENKELNEHITHQFPYMKPGSYVLLTVSDTGCGMNSEELSHIFEPFFTTKKSRGTGLGLSSVYGIVKQSNGLIDIDSKPGRGTVVSIYLPRVDKPAGITEKRPKALRLPAGSETILVVEDEEKVGKIVVKVLSGCGYNILMAPDGEEAFTLWQQNKDRVDLLLTDIVLPGISGLQLSQKILALKPDLKVIYMSGYSDEVISQYGTLDKEVSFIQKPFTSGTLAGKIRQVLDE